MILLNDDAQVYGFCHPCGTDDLQGRLSDCISDVASWMQSNRLQLNVAKTEVLWCSSTTPITVGTTVRDLDSHIDYGLTMRAHVAKTVSNCFSMLRRIRSIRRSVTKHGFTIDPSMDLWRYHAWIHDGSIERPAKYPAMNPWCNHAWIHYGSIDRSTMIHRRIHGGTLTNPVLQSLVVSMVSIGASGLRECDSCWSTQHYVAQSNAVCAARRNATQMLGTEVYPRYSVTSNSYEFRRD